MPNPHYYEGDGDVIGPIRRLYVGGCSGAHYAELHINEYADALRRQTDIGHGGLPRDWFIVSLSDATAAEKKQLGKAGLLPPISLELPKGPRCPKCKEILPKDAVAIKLPDGRELPFKDCVICRTKAMPDRHDWFHVMTEPNYELQSQFPSAGNVAVRYNGPENRSSFQDTLYAIERAMAQNFFDLMTSPPMTNRIRGLMAATTVVFPDEEIPEALRALPNFYQDRKVSMLPGYLQLKNRHREGWPLPYACCKGKPYRQDPKAQELAEYDGNYMFAQDNTFNRGLPVNHRKSKKPLAAIDSAN